MLSEDMDNKNCCKNKAYTRIIVEKDKSPWSH